MPLGSSGIQKQVKTLPCAAYSFRGIFVYCSAAVKRTFYYLLHASVCLTFVEKAYGFILYKLVLNEYVCSQRGI